MCSQSRKGVKEPTFLGRPFGLLGIVVVMGVSLFYAGERWRAHQPSPKQHVLPQPAGPLELIRSEGAAFHPSVSAVPLTHQPDTDVKVRTLADAYSLRHYPGAPPRIPHAVESTDGSGQSCNVCHERGGFVSKYNAYTPVTPHPDYSNCMQCHVEKITENRFVETSFVAQTAPALHRPALPGGPPPIPHTLQLRENCVACHAGPAAPLAIRTTHPERINCRQCHVPSDGEKAFSRSLSSLAKAGTP